MPVETDERLMQQTALGKRDALTALMRRHANAVLTYLRRMTGDEPLSEELFQDVFLAVWTHRRRYRYPRSFRAWLFGIAVNKCRAALRRRGEPAVSLELPGVPAPLAAARSPAEDAVATETATLVERAVMRLPAAQRSVVVLRMWNDLPYADIARILERTEATVRSHMCLGLASLRKILEPQLRE
jgi:RNA polymerase sigma-70 factor (ECF subfamily)